MPVIGIISNSNNIIEKESKIKKQLNEENLVLINENALANIKNIKFDIILIYEEMKKIDQVKEIIKHTKYLIINTDYKKNLLLLDEEVECSVITFGFSPKATITIVSNENEEIILEVQREINNIYGQKIECQEIKLNNNHGKNQIYEEISMKILTFLVKI